MKKYPIRSVVSIRIAKIGTIVLSGVLCLFGLFLLLHLSFSGELVETWIGIAMILFGLIRIQGYYAKDLYRLAFEYDRELGALLLLLGIAVLVRDKHTLSGLLLAFGIFLVADGLFRLRICADARAFGVKSWRLLMILSILSGAVGLVMMFIQGENAAIASGLLGGALLAEGILNLSVTLTTVKIIFHQHPDLIDSYEQD